MSGTPGDEPTVEDPWAVSTAKPTATPEAGLPQSWPQTPQQVEHMAKAQAGQAKLMARMTWPRALAWTLTGVISRVLGGATLIVFAIENAHMHSLLVSPTTTYAEWNSAVQSEHSLDYLGIFTWLGLLVPYLAWQQARGYVAKLPGVAPHPMQASNAAYRSTGAPAYWPPVPEGTASWTRHLHWRVPPMLTLVYAIALAVPRFLLNGASPATHHEVYMVTQSIAAVMILTAAGLDLVRLRAYSRWPKRP